MVTTAVPAAEWRSLEVRITMKVRNTTLLTVQFNIDSVTGVSRMSFSPPLAGREAGAVKGILDYKGSSLSKPSLFCAVGPYRGRAFRILSRKRIWLAPAICPKEQMLYMRLLRKDED